MHMPQVTLDNLKSKLNDEDFSIAQRVVARSHIRSTKPAGNDYISRCASYVWRMVVFHTSSNSQHQMFPAAAVFWYLPTMPYDERTQLMKRLDKIVDEIEELIPKEQWYGVIRWAGLI